MSDYSTADRFIRVMAKLNEIDPSTDEPMRHQMRRLKHLANELIDSALRQAEGIAWQALDLPGECEKAIKERDEKKDAS
jgi:tRNA nucleotidyltransferase/poly(A) polymerase